ncbi:MULTISPECIES: magnesium/cobalt transporter CorA [Aminobacterium]|jgi:magnesium transporter|uniref:magnesium/cobalt transporter CorA n=1 Tax=Aminobacterium TaxID=81466 RepID=UPI000465880A|nr:MULTISPECIES: magnesium/cobalt transporter CorA [Aminobacterium]
MTVKGKHNPRTAKTGLPPGSLVHVGEQKTRQTSLRFMQYSENIFTEKSLSSLDEFDKNVVEDTEVWLDIMGIHDIPVVESIGERFSIHHLVLEDILNTEQRPKAEDHDAFVYVILKMLDIDPVSLKIRVEQVSLILGNNLILSFQEEPGDVFDPVRERIRSAAGRFRRLGADYLLYALMDAIVDRYFVILECIGESIEEIEEALLENPDAHSIHDLYLRKRELLTLRHAVWPLREAVNSLRKTDNRLIQPETLAYFEDLYDHVIQVIDTVETFRETIASMLDLYLSSLSNRMNEVMRVLTVISTLFIPLTFIVGVYGMNFKYMPELDWKWGYIFVWLLMGLIISGMGMWFKRKKWF